MCKEGDPFDRNSCTNDEHGFDVSYVPAKCNRCFISTERRSIGNIEMGGGLADHYVMSVPDHGYNAAAG